MVTVHLAWKLNIAETFYNGGAYRKQAKRNFVPERFEGLFEKS